MRNIFIFYVLCHSFATQGMTTSCLEYTQKQEQALARALDQIIENDNVAELKMYTTLLNRDDLLRRTICKGMLACVQSLLEIGACINGNDSTTERNPVYIALTCDDHSMADFLLARGADLDTRIACGEYWRCTLLVDHFNLHEKNEQRLAWLFDRGAQETIATRKNNLKNLKQKIV